MPLKELFSQADRNGLQKTFKFGGGANTVFANDDAITPRSFGYIINGGGGNDTIFGSDFDDQLTDPVTDEPLFDPVTGRPLLGGDTLIGGDGSDTVVGGGGDDTIYGGNTGGSDASKGRNSALSNLLIGDGASFDADGNLVSTLTVAADSSITASSDTIVGGDGAMNVVFADYDGVTLSAGNTGITAYTGGDDTVTGGSNGADNDVFGDAQTPILAAGSSFTGGKDTLIGGANSSNTFYGDIFGTTVVAGASFTGGMDTLTGGIGGGNFFYGDADGIVVDAGATLAKGGNDILQAGAGGTNMLFGDVVSVSGTGVFQGGNDRLIAGAGGNDTLVGDWSSDSSGNAIGGADIFEIHLGTGSDTVWDFETLNVDLDGNVIGDVVELHGFSVTDFASLDFTDNVTLNRTTLDLGGGDQIVFLNHQEADFSVDDFMFYT